MLQLKKNPNSNFHANNFSLNTQKIKPHFDKSFWSWCDCGERKDVILFLIFERQKTYVEVF